MKTPVTLSQFATRKLNFFLIKSKKDWSHRLSEQLADDDKKNKI